jgi:hypothetical protein
MSTFGSQELSTESPFNFDELQINSYDANSGGLNTIGEEQNSGHTS